MIVFPNIIYALTSGIITPIYRYIYPSEEQLILIEIREIRDSLRDLKDQGYIIIEKEYKETSMLIDRKGD